MSDRAGSVLRLVGRLLIEVAVLGFLIGTMIALVDALPRRVQLFIVPPMLLTVGGIGVLTRVRSSRV